MDAQDASRSKEDHGEHAPSCQENHLFGWRTVLQDDDGFDVNVVRLTGSCLRNARLARKH